MKINMNLLNIEAKRLTEVPQNVTINNNSTITQVSSAENILSIGFVFTSKYEPEIGLIKIEGEISIEDSKEKIIATIDEWEKSGKKNLPKDIAEKVHNTILVNCIVEATILSREVRLPAPFPTPKVAMYDKHDSDEDIRTYIR